MVDNAKISIFAGSAGQEFAERMCKYLNMPLGKSSVIRFSDGNVFVRAASARTMSSPKSCSGWTPSSAPAPRPSCW